MWRILAIVAALATATALWLYVAGLRADLADTHAELAAQREAAQMLDAHLRRQAEQAARWREFVEQSDQIGGADDPLNDYERAILDRVRK